MIKNRKPKSKSRARAIDSILTKTFCGEDSEDLQALRSRVAVLEEQNLQLQEKVAVLEARKDNKAVVFQEKAAKLLFEELLVIRYAQKEDAHHCEGRFFSYLANRQGQVSDLLQPYIEEKNLATTYLKEAKRIKKMFDKQHPEAKLIENINRLHQSQRKLHRSRTFSSRSSSSSSCKKLELLNSININLSERNENEAITRLKPDVEKKGHWK